jgi:hypothetical protein
MKNKLRLTDTGMDVVIKMSDGNPGAMQVSMLLVKEDMKSILFCDNIGLYGSELYMLWSDCCNRDIGKTIKVLNLLSECKISEDEFWRRVKGNGYGLSFDDLLEVEEERSEAK